MPERSIEISLCDRVARLGGWAIKIPALHVTGIPDRLCLLPGGRLFFAETKAPGKKPRSIQKIVHARLQALGFRVEVIDSKDQIVKILKEYERNRPA